MTAGHRYDQCGDTCTADCGHRKGKGRPVMTSTQPPAPAPDAEELREELADIRRQTSGMIYVRPFDPDTEKLFQLVDRLAELVGYLIPQEPQFMTSTEPTAPAYRVEKQSYSRGAWRVLHAATGEQVFENGTFDHPTMGRIRLAGPVCFDRKRDAVAWVEAHKSAPVVSDVT